MDKLFESEIKLIWPKGRVVPIPLIGGLNLHKHLYAYLVTRLYYPKNIRLSMSKVSGASLRQIAYDLKAFLDALSFNGINYLEADFTDHIEKILTGQLGDSAPSTYNNRFTRVRDFYEYLTNNGVPTKARFPAKSIKKRYLNQDQNFLSHTSHKNSRTYEKDDGHKKTTQITDYKDQVISIDKYGQLYRALKEIDIVYSTLAQVMMQTFLRVADVCEMPLHTNNHNKYLHIWPEFERNKMDVLRYSCLTKTSKLVTIDIFPDTVQALYQDYIQPCFRQRKELFESRYMKRKNATLEFGNIRDDSRRSCPKDILWLTATGTPVKPYMIEQAFRETGLNVNPHMLRHTGATHTLWNYCRIYEIEPDVALASSFQQILKGQLGHADLETTIRYICTIQALKGRKTMPFCIPSNKQELDDHLAKVIRADVTDLMARFFEFRGEKSNLESIEN